MRGFYQKAFVILFICVATFFVRDVFATTNSNEAAAGEIIVTVVNGRVRSEPSLKSTILREMKVGTRLPFIEENGGWYRVTISSGTETENETTGWISKTISKKFEGNPDPIFQQIANRYFQRRSLNFATAVQLFDFLGPAADDARTYETGGNLRLLRLMTLARAIAKINYEESKRSPYKPFLERNASDVIYHEPAGMWIVKSDSFWELHSRYKKHKIGEKIAWYGAKNPLPGECEGYVVCHLNYLRVTTGEYLNFYPNGKYSKQALKDVINMLQPIVADLPEKRTYTPASDISDRAEFNRILSELRKIISKMPYLEKNKALEQIRRIAEGHR